jgi:hypothetical protein
MSGAERTELREVIAQAIWDEFDFSRVDQWVPWKFLRPDQRDMLLGQADAVLSVLPGTDAEDAAAIRRVMQFVKACGYGAESVVVWDGKPLTDDDVARLARLGQG